MRQYPLYRIKLNGLNVESVEPLFEVITGIKKMKEEIGELNAKFKTKIITSTTSDYGNMDTGLSATDGAVISAKLMGCVCIPYIGSTGDTWSINVRSSGNFSAYSNKKVNVEILFFNK